MPEQLDLSGEEGWALRSREERMIDASLIRFVYRGLEISYLNEKQTREQSLAQLRAWFPETQII